jgi:hypothetical protein
MKPACGIYYNAPAVSLFPWEHQISSAVPDTREGAPLSKNCQYLEGIR